MSKRSPVWDWFDDTDELQIKKCKLCNSKVKFTAKSNSNLHKHMQNVHDWRIEAVLDGLKIICSK